MRYFYKKNFKSESYFCPLNPANGYLIERHKISHILFSPQFLSLPAQAPSSPAAFPSKHTNKKPKPKGNFAILGHCYSLVKEALSGLPEELFVKPFLGLYYSITVYLSVWFPLLDCRFHENSVIYPMCICWR